MANFSHLQGWINRPKEVEKVVSSLPVPYFGAISHMKGSGGNTQALLHKIVKDVIGYYPVTTQAIGDCVSHACAGGVTALQAIEVALEKDEEFGGIIATEPIYGDSRVLIGKGSLGYGDGSIMAWACQGIQQYGTLVRKNYPEQGIDLSKYSGQRAKDWGSPNKGTPASLREISKQHIVRLFSKVTSYTEVLDALASGYPVVFGAQFGVNNTRDKNGMSRRGPNWSHAQLVIASDPTFSIPSCLIVNSWGAWNSGPKRYEFDPDGSYWVDASSIDYICRQGDAFALSSYQGFELRDLNLKIV